MKMILEMLKKLVLGWFQSPHSLQTPSPQEERGTTSEEGETTNPIENTTSASPTHSAKNSATPPPPSVVSRHIDLHRRLLDHLNARYEFRYNLLTEEPEYRPISSEDNFQTIDRRVFNTMMIEAVDEG